MSALVEVFDAEVVSAGRYLPVHCTVHVALQAAPAGPLTETTHRWVVAGQTLNDAAVAAGVDIYPGTTLRLYLNGVVVPDERWDSTYVRDGDEVVAHYEPRVQAILIGLWTFAQAAATYVLPGALGIGYLAAPLSAPWLIYWGTTLLIYGSLLTGVYYVAQLAINALAPSPPKLPKQETADRLYSITGSNNSMEPWSPLARVYGRHLIYPRHGTRPFTRLEGNDQYFSMLGVIGRGKYTIERINLGNTSIDVLPAEYQVIEDPIEQAQTILPSQVDEKPLAIEYKAGYFDSDPQEEVTLDSGSRLSLDLQWPQGLRRIKASGGGGRASTGGDNPYASVAVALAIAIREYDPQTGTYKVGSSWLWPQWSFVGQAGANAANQRLGGKRFVATQSATTLGDSSQSWDVDEWVAWQVVVKRDGQGGFEQTRTIVSNTATVLTVDTPFSPAIAAQDEYYIQAPNVWRVAGNTVDHRRCSIFYDVPNPNAFYAVRVRRIGTILDRSKYTQDQGGEGPVYKMKKGEIVHDEFGVPIEILGSGGGATAAHYSHTAWTALRIERYESPIRLSHVSCIAAKFKANERLQGQIQDLNCMVYSHLPDILPNGTLGPLIETRNPALVLYDIWTGETTYERDRLDPADIDMLKLYALKERCEPIHEHAFVTAVGAFNELVDNNRLWEQNEHVDQYVILRPGLVTEERRRVVSNTGQRLTVTPGWSVPPVAGDEYDIRRYRFAVDRYVQGDMTMEEIEHDVLAVCRASYSLSESGKHSVIWDDPQTVPVQMFTAANVRNFSWERSLRPAPHAFEITYANPAKRWVEDVFRVYADGYNADGSGGMQRAVDIEPLPIKGVTDPLILHREARYRMKNGELRDTKYKFETDWEFIVCRRGDLVRFQHPSIQEDSAAGDVVAKLTDPENEQLVRGILIDRPFFFKRFENYGLRVRRTLDNGHFTVLLDNPANDLPFGTDEMETNELIFAQSLSDGSTLPSPGDLWAAGLANIETKEGLVLSIKPARTMDAEIELVEYAPAIYNVDLETLGVDGGSSVTQPWNPEDVPPNKPLIQHVAFAFEGSGPTSKLMVLIDVRSDLTLNATAQRVPVKGFQARVRFANQGELDESGVPFGLQPWRDSEIVLASAGFTRIAVPLDTTEVWSAVDIEVVAISPWDIVSPINQKYLFPIYANISAASISFQDLTPEPQIGSTRRYLRVTWVPSSPEAGEYIWHVNWWIEGEGYSYNSDELFSTYFDIPDPIVGATYSVTVWATKSGSPGPALTAQHTYLPAPATSRPLAPNGFEITGQGLDLTYTGRDIPLSWQPQLPPGVLPPEIGDEPNGANSAAGVTTAGERYDLEVRDPTTLNLIQLVNDLSGSLTSYLYKYEQRSSAAKALRTLELLLYRETSEGIRSIPARIEVTNPKPGAPTSVALSASLGDSSIGAKAFVQFVVSPGEGFADEDAVRCAVWGSTSGSTFTPAPGNYIGQSGEGETHFQLPVDSNQTWWFKVGIVDRFHGDPSTIGAPASEVNLAAPVSINVADALGVPVETDDIAVGAVLEAQSFYIDTVSINNGDLATWVSAGSVVLATTGIVNGSVVVHVLGSIRLAPFSGDIIGGGFLTRILRNGVVYATGPSFSQFDLNNVDANFRVYIPMNFSVKVAAVSSGPTTVTFQIQKTNFNLQNTPLVDGVVSGILSKTGA